MVKITLPEDRYKFETQVVQTKNGFEGVTYSYKTTVFYGKASCVGAISPKTKKVLLNESNLLEVKSFGSGACLMTCFLQYSKVGNEEFLEGKYTSISVRDSTGCGGGTVFLRKVTNSDFYEEPFLANRNTQKPPLVAQKTTPPPVKKIQPDPPVVSKTPTAPKKTIPQPKTPPKTVTPPKKEETAVAPKKSGNLKTSPADSAKPKKIEHTAPIAIPQVLASRTNELVQTISTSAREVEIKIYDNGSIDNDTVSVYVNKKLFISRQRLTDKAISLKINLADGADIHELVMVAENLGEIPPNTSLMVVTAGEQRFEVRITSTEQKNAVVRFKYEGE